jgi:ferredoxin
MSEETIIEETGKKLEDIKKESEGKVCPVQRALYFIEEFIAGPMCSKCYPCAFGTAEARIRLSMLTRHQENVCDEDINVLKRIGFNMTGSSLCKKGKDTGKFLIETLDNSPVEFKEHLSGNCPGKECISLFEYFINPELCIMCGKCSEVCKANAIIGEKREPYLSGHLPFEILQRKCTKCGECIKVCANGAIAFIKQETDIVVCR